MKGTEPTDAPIEHAGARTVRSKARPPGQAMVEYALILVLIAIAVIVIVGVVGHQVNNAFSNISHGLGS